jgi:hypothetical protein
MTGEHFFTYWLGRLEFKQLPHFRIRPGLAKRG